MCPYQPGHAQDFGFREIKAPYQDNFVLLELYGMIYEPGLLSDISLSVSVKGDGNWHKARTLYLIFPKGKEFHFGNTDSLSQIGIKPAKLNLANRTAYRLDQNIKAYVDSRWLEEVRGELYFNVLWDAMADVGELKSDQVLFKVEGDFVYDDNSILAKSGIEDVFTDPRDQQEYRIVQIGEAVWMKDNLRFEASFSKKKNDFIEQTDAGIIYSWWNAKKACPTGWRLPTESDFMYLKSFYENERHLIPGGVSHLDLQSIYYDLNWDYWTSTPSEPGYITTFKFEWLGLEKGINKAGGLYSDVGEWPKSLIRCVKGE